MSVAMCTHQGEAYVLQQLRSIAGQTRPPDELVIRDDCSTDQTVALVRQFARDAAFRVNLTVNEHRLGVARNFEKSIGQCKGEFIFCADQDDVWHPQKLQKLVERLESAPSAGFVFCNAQIVDEDLEPTGRTLWGSLGFTADIRREFLEGGALAYMLREGIAAGMTMGFRSGFKSLVLPVPAGWGHDHFIPLLIASVAEAELVPECLVQWRQHTAQQTGVSRVRLDRRVRAAVKRDAADQSLKMQLWKSAHQRLLDNRAQYAVPPQVLDQFAAKVQHLHARSQIQRRVSSWQLLRDEVFSGNYSRYSRGWWSVASDVLLRS